MKARVYIFLIVQLVLISCQRENELSTIEGNWWYINPIDSSYTELYCTKEFLILNVEHAGVLGVEAYGIRKDSVFLSDNTLMFKIARMEGDSIIMAINHKAQAIKLTRLQLPPLRNFCLPDSKKVELQTGRLLRDPSVHGESTDMDGQNLEILPPEN